MAATNVRMPAMLAVIESGLSCIGNSVRASVPNAAVIQNGVGTWPCLFALWQR